MSTDDALRYPVGHFEAPETLTPAVLAAWIDEIEALPVALRAAVEALAADLIDTSYREGGWTVRQIVHHVADSHSIACERIKRAITEDEPHVNAYDENAWARLPDNRLSVEVSLRLIESIHARWAVVLRALGPDDWGRVFVHSERGRVRVDHSAGMYAWHGRHHLAHVRLVVEASGSDASGDGV